MPYDIFPELEEIDDMYRPSYGYTIKEDKDVSMVQFGEGYQQIIPRRLNPVTKTFDTSWNNRRYNFSSDPREDEEGNIIYNFLQDHFKSDPFWFRELPREPYKLVICEELSISFNNFDLADIRATFKTFKGFDSINPNLKEDINGRQ